MNKISLMLILSMVMLIASCQKEAVNQKPKMENGQMNYIETFKIKSCDKIIIESYKKASDARDGKQGHTAEIDDQQIIDQVLGLLNQLPDQGDKMIKMGDTSLLKVILMSGDNVEYFNFYGQLLKTPDTSFYSEPPPAVEQLYSLLRDRL